MEFAAVLTDLCDERVRVSAESGIWEYRLGRKGLWDCQRLSPCGVFVLNPVSAFCLGILVKNGQAKNRHRYLFSCRRRCVEMRMNR